VALVNNAYRRLEYENTVNFFLQFQVIRATLLQEVDVAEGNLGREPMITGVAIAAAYVALGAIVILFDVYLIHRRRWLSPEYQARFLLPPGPGVDVTGELTTSAKYAIWNYMFRILGVGGTIVGIIAGVAGYMINDLGKQEAIRVALNEMQKPLAEQLVALANAKAGVDAVAKSLTTDEFKAIVAAKLSADSIFANGVSKILASTYADQLRGKPGQDAVSPSVDDVAHELATKYANQLRGDPGAKGADGVSPAPADVAMVLTAKYSNELRGPPGAPGQNGNKGVDGVSPTAAEVAVALVAQHINELRGPPGPAGQNGKDGASPTPEAVAEVLAKGYVDKLRGPAGAAGKDGISPDVNAVAAALASTFGDRLRGMQGPPGKDGVSPSVEAVTKHLATQHRDELRGARGEPGKDGTSPTAEAVAAAIFAKNRDQLRGPQGLPGKDGKNGKDGASPSVEVVATTLWNQHGNEIRDILTTKQKTRARKKRGR
jgi:hypothetical protein